MSTPLSVAREAPLSMGFSRQEYWSGIQGIFPTQGLNMGLLLCKQILYHLSHQGSYSQFRQKPFFRLEFHKLRIEEGKEGPRNH